MNKTAEIVNGTYTLGSFHYGQYCQMDLGRIREDLLRADHYTYCLRKRGKRVPNVQSIQIPEVIKAMTYGAQKSKCPTIVDAFKHVLSTFPFSLCKYFSDVFNIHMRVLISRASNRSNLH
jgi:hypothetical protein